MGDVADDAVEAEAEHYWEGARAVVTGYKADTGDVRAPHVPPWRELTEAHKIVFGMGTNSISSELVNIASDVLALTETEAIERVARMLAVHDRGDRDG